MSGCMAHPAADEAAPVVHDPDERSNGRHDKDRHRAEETRAAMPPEVVCLFSLLMREMDRRRQRGAQESARGD